MACSSGVHCCTYSATSNSWKRHDEPAIEKQAKNDRRGRSLLRAGSSSTASNTPMTVFANSRPCATTHTFSLAVVALFLALSGVGPHGAQAQDAGTGGEDNTVSSEDESGTSVWSTLLQYFIIVVLVGASGMFSGLTLGLLGLDKIGLEIIGNGDEARMAAFAKVKCCCCFGGKIFVLTVRTELYLSHIISSACGTGMGYIDQPLQQTDYVLVVDCDGVADERPLVFVCVVGSSIVSGKAVELSRVCGSFLGYSIVQHSKYLLGIFTSHQPLKLRHENTGVAARHSQVPVKPQRCCTTYLPHQQVPLSTTYWLRCG